MKTSLRSNPILQRALRQTRFPSLRLTLAGVGGLWLACALASLIRGSAAWFASPGAQVVRQVAWLTPMLTFFLSGVIAVRQLKSDILKEVYQTPLPDERITLGYGQDALLRLRGLVALAVGMLPVLAYGPVSLGYVLATCLLALHLLAALVGTALGLRWGPRAPVGTIAGMIAALVILILRGVNIPAPTYATLGECLPFYDLNAFPVMFQFNLLRLRWIAPAPLPELGLLFLLVGLCRIALGIPIRELRNLRATREIAGGLLILLLFLIGDVWLTTRIERRALIAIYHANGGEIWPDSENWLSERPVCQWTGVGCACGYVESLYREELVGDLSPAIGRLTNLDYLLVGGPQLQSLPPEIGHLTNLSSFGLRDSSVASLPPEIKHLTQVRLVDISGNSQLRRLPPEIGRFTRLRGLSLIGNNLSSLPPEIFQLTNLKYLDLFDNQLTELPPEIGDLTALEILDVSLNPLNTLPPEIGHLSELRGIAVAGAKLAAVPPELAQMRNLESIWFPNNNLTTLPPEVYQIESLLELSVSDNRLTELPAGIGQLTHLKELDLSGNELTSLPPEIGQLSNLELLDVSNNRLAEIPGDIGQLSKLTTLRMSDNQIRSLPYELSQLPLLSELEAARNPLEYIPPEVCQLESQNMYVLFHACRK